jgi:apolipoprotein N-acyltransferase
LAAGVVFAAYHAAASAVAPTGRWRIVGRPAAHALAEALRFSFPFGGVPLASLGMSQVGGPLVAPVRVGGVVLLSWLVLQLGVALGAAVSARPWSAASATLPGPDRVRPDQRGLGVAAAGAAIAVVIVVVAATVAPRGSDRGETIRVAAVQGGGEQGTSADDVPSIEVTRRHLDTTSSIAPDPELDVVLWPENTIDVEVFGPAAPSRSDRAIHEAIVAEAGRLGVPIAVGITEDAAARRFTNAQVVVTPDGEIVSRYDKVRRVPFGEYVPFRSFVGLFSARIDRIGDAVAGATPAVLDVPVASLGRDVEVATVISWEVFFGGRAREGVALGGEVIVNPTNGASYTGTIVQTQQVASSRLRAIETGRWVVQAAPTGFTAVVTDRGEVVERTAQKERRVILADVPLRTGETWYVRLGDGPWIATLLAVLGVAIWRSRPALPHRLRRLVTR